MDTPSIKPSRWYYVLAAIVFVAGWGLFAVFLFLGLRGLGSKLQRVVVPGQSELALTEAGDHTIFYEFHSVVGNRVYSTDENLSGLECELVSKATGARVPISASFFSTTYSVGSHEGKSLFDFHVDQPGAYTLSAAYAAGHEGPEIVLTVGQGIFVRIAVTVFGGFSSLFVCLALAAAMAVITLIKRSKAKKRLASGPGSS